MIKDCIRLIGMVAFILCMLTLRLKSEIEAVKFDEDCTGVLLDADLFKVHADRDWAAYVEEIRASTARTDEIVACSTASRAFHRAQAEEQAAANRQAIEVAFKRDLARIETERRQAAAILMMVGQFSEACGKAQTPGFKASFLRQFGVQFQVKAMELNGQVSVDPVLATLQGFLVGL